MSAMNEEVEIIISLLETMNAAIDAQDWKVDGANDPDLAMKRASAYLKQRGYIPDGLTGETWIKTD
jgi:hypothetical protein